MFKPYRRLFCLVLSVIGLFSSAVVLSIFRRQLTLLHIPTSSVTQFAHPARSNGNQFKPEPMVRQLHQSWRSADRIPDRFAIWRASWLACLPGWRHRLWTDEDNLLLVRLRAPDFLDHYLRYTENIQRADSARYIYLYHNGGLYTDLDNECLQPFEQVLIHADVNGSLAHCGVLLSSMRRPKWQRPYIENSLMFARRAGHPFWLTVLEVMTEQARFVGVSVQETVDLTTGPQMLMLTLKRYNGADGNPNDNKHGPVCLFPPDRFNPFSWDVAASGGGSCRDLNRMTDAQLAECRAGHRKAGAFVLQYHAQSWGRGKV